jgi:cytochrome P450
MATEPIRTLENGSPDDGYDPFDAFDRAQGAGVVRDPYPEWAELLATGPVHEIDIRRAMGLDPDLELPPDMPTTYSAFSADAVAQVLRDNQTFSSSCYSAVMGAVMGRSILEMDEPDHHAYRALVQQAFTRKAMEKWEYDVVAPIVNDHIDAFVNRGSADLVRELTFPFPVTVIAGMLGLPERDLPQFHRWAVELISVGFDMERAIGASQKLRDYFAAILAERRAGPSDDVISVLSQAELEGQKLTDDEIFAFLRLLLPAGAETTYRSSSNLLMGLLSHPDQLDALRADRSLLPMAVEEGLRWETPLTGIVRIAMRDADVCGVPIAAGSLMQVNLGSANHDPTRHAAPERFDIRRPPSPHLAFASGPHMCLGMHLARMETAVVITALLDRLPGLRLDPAASDVHITGALFRSPRALPVVFDA